MRCRLTLVALASLLLLTSCSGPHSTPDPAYRAEIEAAWTEREARLAADDGWLTLVGLTWLEPGVNTVGSAADATVRLPSPAPAVVGAIVLHPDGLVTLDPGDGAALTVDDGPAAPGPLRTDADGAPDVVHAGRFQFYVITRGDRTGVRVKDPEAPTRREFSGLDHFPVDPTYRIEATFEPYPEPRQVSVPTVIGEPTIMFAPGLLRFAVTGQDVTLEPYVSNPADRDLFIVFRDSTSGISTYGAGRFLSAELETGSGRVVLDFNLAVNPPCAFTPYATCPLPTPENSLPVPIEAGERFAGSAH